MTPIRRLQLRRVLLGLWCLLCLFAPTRHFWGPVVFSASDGVAAPIGIILENLPPFRFRWGMFTTLMPYYRIPSFTNEQGVETVATQIMQTPAFLYKPSRVIWAATISDEYIGFRCVKDQWPQPLNVTRYYRPVTQGEPSSDWAYFQVKEFETDVCARFRR